MEPWTEKALSAIGGEAALKKALSRGGDFGELYFEDSSSTSVVMEDGRIEKVVTGFDAGAGLRVVFDDRQSFAATNRLTPADLMDAAQSTAAAVDRGAPWEAVVATPGRLGPDFTPQKAPDSVDTAVKVDLLRRADAAARALGDQIRQVKVIYADHVKRVMILREDGRLVGDERTSLIFMVQVTAADGDLLQVGYEPVGGAIGFEVFDQYPPETVAETAARRALMMLTAQEAPSGTMPVILSSEAGGTMIHEAVGHGLEADLAGEGLSVYADRVGRTVASNLVTVLDDATMPYKRGSFAVDDEGEPAQKTLLVEAGVLQGYMHDRRSARKAGVKPTGNGRRESYRRRPTVRMTNTLIAPGRTNPDDVLAATDRGLFVRKMGGGQVNTVNGDFVFNVSEGYLIENGRLGPPVRGATLTGNGPEVLKEIDMVGNDLGFAIGTCGKDGQGAPVADAQPTLRLPQIVVGGRG